MMGDCECHGDVYCSDCGATLAQAERERDEARDALRAYDAAQAKDSGGSGRIPGSATREAAHASSSGPEPGPEPAGTTQAAERFLDEWNRLSAVRRATMRETFPALHAAFVAAFPSQTPKPFGHISKADECQIDSELSVGVAAAAEAPVAEHVTAEMPRVRVPGGWLYQWECAAYNGCPGGATATFVPDATADDDKPGLPLTRADLDALEERIVERVAGAASVSDRQRYANDCNTHPMSRLADELRRKP